MGRPNLEKIDNLLLSGESFSLTETQYQKETDANLPKNCYYLRNKSAIAKLAKKHGYIIKIKERTIIFERGI